MTQSSAVPSWLGVVGVGVGAVLIICSLEFVGRAETEGWNVAAALTPPTYVAWSLWLAVTGVALLT